MEILQASYIKKIVENSIKQNSDEISELLLDDLDDSMSLEQIVPRLITKSISISSQLSVQIILELLCNAGIVEVKEELLRRSSLTIVKD